MDALEGFRAEPIPDLSQEEQQLDEFENDMLKDHPTIPLELVKAVRLGIETRKFIKNSPVGKHLFQCCMEHIEAASRDWMDEDDPGSEKARACHFNARVANTILDWLNDALRVGREAEQRLLEEENV